MKTIILILLSLALISCNQTANNLQQSPNSTQTISIPEHPGKKLMETNCFACHGGNLPAGAIRIAPPMPAIKMRYLMGDPTKEEFVNKMVKFVTNPTEEHAIMYGAVSRFGVMPKQAFTAETVQQIADYLFDNQLEAVNCF